MEETVIIVWFYFLFVTFVKGYEKCTTGISQDECYVGNCCKINGVWECRTDPGSLSQCDSLAEQDTVLTPKPSSGNQTSDSNSLGVPIGVAVGCLVMLIIIVIVGVYIRRRKPRKSASSNQLLGDLVSQQPQLSAPVWSTDLNQHQMNTDGDPPLYDNIAAWPSSLQYNEYSKDRDRCTKELNQPTSRKRQTDGTTRRTADRTNSWPRKLMDTELTDTELTDTENKTRRTADTKNRWPRKLTDTELSDTEDETRRTADTTNRWPRKLTDTELTDTEDETRRTADTTNRRPRKLTDTSHAAYNNGNSRIVSNESMEKSSYDDQDTSANRRQKRRTEQNGSTNKHADVNPPSRGRLPSRRPPNYAHASNCTEV